MNVLVTGGAGFIGTHLTKKLLEEGHHVVVIDNLSTGCREDVPSDADFLELDLVDESSYKKIPEDIELVYHLASQVSGEVSCEDPVHDLKANSLATLALLQWSKKNNINKFIFASSMGLYDDKLMEPATEESRVLPKSFYGVNKQASEGFIRIFSEEGMRTTVVRLFNVYGPGQNMANLKQGMLSIYMAYILNQRAIQVKGPLDRGRDFVYIDDVVNAFLLARSRKADGQTYNICTGRKTTVQEALDEIKSAFGVEANYPIEILDRTPRDIDVCWGDYGLIQSELGWKPLIVLDVGLRRMVHWLRGGVEK